MQPQGSLLGCALSLLWIHSPSGASTALEKEPCEVFVVILEQSRVLTQGRGAVGDAVQSEQQWGSPQVQEDQRCLKGAGSKHSLLGQWRPVCVLGQFLVISISREGHLNT